MERLTLAHPGGETSLWAGFGALQAAAPALTAWLEGRLVFVVTTPRVWGLHGSRLEAALAGARRAEVLEIAEGEAAKTLATAGELWQRMALAGGKRDSRLIAFGGGSACDVGGFVAACFTRGIEVAQVPTTLLAQVDAAIGGKTGVDLPAAKNLVGAFHHPRYVVADTSVLATLPPEEVRSGLAEVVKMGFLLDPALFAAVEEHLSSLLARDPEQLGPVVAAAARAKIAVVELDPTEQDQRRLLNFGHTLGHALETAAGYLGLRHGEAVAWGMLFALRLSLARGLDQGAARRLAALIARLGLPPLPAFEVDELLTLMARDKKAKESGLTWVLAERLGQGRMVEGIAEEEIRAELAAFLASPGKLFGLPL
ncbi:MAG TPA: 3-dehydroquinate synthase [Thermoanaerobaculia bacterium]|nr:3-dehydroquinate synthase [Thermoanaerobaculia bacterium]